MEITTMAITALIMDTGMIMVTLILVDTMDTINSAVMILGTEDSMTCMDMVRIIMALTMVHMIFQISMALSTVLRKPLMGMDLIMEIATTSTMTTSILTTMVSIMTFMHLIMELAAIKHTMVLIIWQDTIYMVSIIASMVLIICLVMILMDSDTPLVMISMV